MKNISLVILIILVVFSACREEEAPESPSDQIPENNSWLVDTNKLSGTSIIHIFPLVTQPYYSKADDVTYYNPKEPVVVFKISDQIFIYPHWMLGIEVVNDSYGEVHFAVTFCPLTETSYVIDRVIDNELHTFRASGILYQDNLVYYDLETESLWSQMLFRSIHGSHMEKSPQLINSFESSFEAAQTYFPEGLVFVDFEGSNTFKKTSGHGNMPNESDMIKGFPGHSTKPGYLSVLNLTHLEGKGLITEENLLIVYHKDYGFTNAFLPITGLSFEFVDEFPLIMTDNEGNSWDVFGKAIEGPRKGQQLEGSVSFLAWWWAWKGIYNSFQHLEND